MTESGLGTTTHYAEVGNNHLKAWKSDNFKINLFQYLCLCKLKNACTKQLTVEK